MISGRSNAMLLLSVLGVSGRGAAFTSVARTTFLAHPSVGNAFPNLKMPPLGPSLSLHLNNPHPKSKRKTALSVSWPFNGDSKESEGKRDTDSRLKLSGDASEAASLPSFLPAFPSPESLEELTSPVSAVLDDVTDGWALSYANLEPEDETTPIGLSFLATNIAYGIAGSLLVMQGNTFLGLLTEMACLASFGYHFSQLKFGQSGSRIVRLALLVDYVFALSAIIVGSIQLFFSHQFPTEVLFGGSLAIASLGACWVWEEGVIYIIFHSLWHLFSAYTGYVIGSTQ